MVFEPPSGGVTGNIRTCTSSRLQPAKTCIWAYESNTHRISRKLKTKYIDNENKIKNKQEFEVLISRISIAV